jgi:hypothetical protein
MQRREGMRTEGGRAGEGAYDGLAAHLAVDHIPTGEAGVLNQGGSRCRRDFKGLIYDIDDLPPTPAAAS